MISDGMFYLSTSPHCNRQNVSNAPLQKITSKAGGGLLSIFLHSEQLRKHPKTLFNDEDKNIFFSNITVEDNIKHRLSQGESKRLHLKI